MNTLQTIGAIIMGIPCASFSAVVLWHFMKLIIDLVKSRNHEDAIFGVLILIALIGFAFVMIGSVVK